MTIRCKMRLDDVFVKTRGGSKALFSCHYDQILSLSDEDRAFQKAIPMGMAEFDVDDQKAEEQLVIGQYYYVDFTPVSED
jgi:hypothetical protein